MTDMDPIALERHLVLIFDRRDTYPKVESATTNSVEQMR